MTLVAGDGSYPSAEKQTVYSTAPVKWAMKRFEMIDSPWSVRSSSGSISCNRAWVHRSIRKCNHTASCPCCSFRKNLGKKKLILAFSFIYYCLFVVASHQTRLDTWSKARRPIKVGIKGRARSGTSRDSNPAGLCCSSAHLYEPDKASSFTNPNVGPGTYAGLWLELDTKVSCHT